MINDIINFIIAGTLFYIYDVCKDDYYKHCDTAYGHFLLWIHHVFNTFLQFGWLSNNKTLLIIYVIAVISVILHWKLNKGLCKVTEITNKLCKLSNDNYFRDIWYVTGLKQKRFKYSFNRMYLVAVISIALFKLFKSVP